MNKLLEYLDNDLINTEYCQKADITEDIFYLRTNYQNEISIDSEESMDFYQRLSKYKLLKDFNKDLIRFFKFYRISVLKEPELNSDDKITFTLESEYSKFIIPSMVYETYSSKNDPLHKDRDEKNSKVNSFIINELKTAEMVDIEDIINRVIPRNCKIISNNYEKCVFIYQDYFIKCMPNTYFINELAHETYINYILNTKTNLPNFSKLIGYKTINKTLIMSPMQTHWKSRINYMITEYVNSISLKTLISRSSIDIILNVMNQIFYTLYDVHVKLGFTHYDLHLNNFIVKNLNEQIVKNLKIL